MIQNVSVGKIKHEELQNLLSKYKKILIVCGNTYLHSELRKNIESWDIPYAVFAGITPNPTYEQVLEGLKIFRSEGCDAVLAIGGGSVIDTGKCIKLFGPYEQISSEDLKGPFEENNIPLIAIPTTAGSGSEATHFAVIYVNGNKISVTHESLLPGHVFLDASFIDTLPRYQRISVMLDALCHAIESMWSVSACEESLRYSLKAVELWWKWKESYLGNEKSGNENMLEAAYYAGKAINITKTTVCHALSYGMVTRFGIAHGHAVALSLSEVYTILREKFELLPDEKKKQLRENFDLLIKVMGVKDFEAILQYVNILLLDLNKYMDVELDAGLLECLTDLINVERLNNFIIILERAEIRKIYSDILT